MRRGGGGREGGRERREGGREGRGGRQREGGRARENEVPLSVACTAIPVKKNMLGVGGHP